MRICTAERALEDLFTRFSEVSEARGRMRPTKVFFGLTLEGFLAAAKPFVEARDEIANLEKQLAHAASKRDAASGALDRSSSANTGVST